MINKASRGGFITLKPYPPRGCLSETPRRALNSHPSSASLPSCDEVYLDWTLTYPRRATTMPGPTTFSPIKDTAPAPNSSGTAQPLAAPCDTALTFM